MEEVAILLILTWSILYILFLNSSLVATVNPFSDDLSTLEFKYFQEFQESQEVIMPVLLWSFAPVLPGTPGPFRISFLKEKTQV